MKVTPARDVATVNVEMTVDEQGALLLMLGYLGGSIRPEDADVKQVFYKWLKEYSAACEASKKL